MAIHNPQPAQNRKDGATSPLKKSKTLNQFVSLYDWLRSALVTCVSIITNTAHPRRRSMNSSKGKIYTTDAGAILFCYVFAWRSDSLISCSTVSCSVLDSFNALRIAASAAGRE